MTKIFESKKLNILIFFMLVLVIIIGNIYLFSVMNKIKLMAEEKKIERELKKIVGDINKLKIEIDEKIDLDRIEKTAIKELKMSMTDKINYVREDKNKK